jgi:hypothetical protein
MGSHGNALRRYTRIARIRCHALDAARHATFGGETFKGALQELGFSKFPFRWRLPFLFHHHEHDDEPAEMGTAMTESLDRARRRTYEQLEKSPTVNEGDMFGNERACRQAHRLFIDALLASWAFSRRSASATYSRRTYVQSRSSHGSPTRSQTLSHASTP